MLNVFICVAYAVVGAMTYRWRGGGYWGENVPRIVKLVHCAALFAVLLQGFPDIPYWAVALVLAATTLTLSLGHSGWQDFGDIDGEEHEWVPEWLLPGEQGEQWHDFVGMCYSGMAIMLPMGMAVAIYHDIWIGAALVALGAMKGVSYVIGWEVYYRELFWKHMPVVGTVLAEHLTGFFLYGGAAVIVLAAS